MIDQAIRDGSLIRSLLAKVGREAVEELLVGRAAVVPLACINEATGQTVVLDELVYNNQKSRVHRPIAEARIDAA
ncbi:hypothetical protein [Paludisphaera rhizosphaerae]|uniref:hypothetical protein n=1 Tax=Paludisphaera rhizosphaerae TaxID=2711216 RepID=UPI0013ECE662|nr:hypothetical protein [Paludisphaera rhizosphaerae]